MKYIASYQTMKRYVYSYTLTLTQILFRQLRPDDWFVFYWLLEVLSHLIFCEISSNWQDFQAEDHKPLLFLTQLPVPLVEETCCYQESTLIVVSSMHCLGSYSENLGLHQVGYSSCQAPLLAFLDNQLFFLCLNNFHHLESEAANQKLYYQLARS